MYMSRFCLSGLGAVWEVALLEVAHASPLTGEPHIEEVRQLVGRALVVSRVAYFSVAFALASTAAQNGTSGEGSNVWVVGLKM